MKITHIKAGLADLGLTRPYTIAYKTVDAVSVAFLELYGENGLVGLGASNPSKMVVGESVEDTAVVLTAENMEWLKGRDIREYRQLIAEANHRFSRFPGVRAAIDIALHDLFTQYLGVPLAMFLGQKIQALPTSITIGIKDVAETMEEAQEYVGRGFRILKVKLGHSLEMDIERLEKLYEHYKKNVLVRIDANQGYTASETEIFYHRTKHLGLELIEQPVPVADTDSLRGLPKEIVETIAVDEALVTPEDAFRLATPPEAGGIFNIKLMKCGGVYNALEIATIAYHSHKQLMWGCNDESIISISAALHAALACENTRYIDLDGSMDLAKDLVEGGFTLKEGFMSVTDAPGLGVRKLLP
jgi:L-alanine-DL-glutamate epimerase-like enolase superfamily enzyme